VVVWERGYIKCAMLVFLWANDFQFQLHIIISTLNGYEGCGLLFFLHPVTYLFSIDIPNTLVRILGTVLLHNRWYCPSLVVQPVYSTSNRITHQNYTRNTVKLLFLVAIKNLAYWQFRSLATTKFSAAFSVAHTCETLDPCTHAARALLVNSKFSTLWCHH